MREKSPREYARAWLAAPTREAKKAAIKGCPEHLHELVNKHVKNEIERRRK